MKNMEFQLPDSQSRQLPRAHLIKWPGFEAGRHCTTHPFEWKSNMRLCVLHWPANVSVALCHKQFVSASSAIRIPGKMSTFIIHEKSWLPKWCACLPWSGEKLIRDTFSHKIALSAVRLSPFLSLYFPCSLIEWWTNASSTWIVHLEFREPWKICLSYSQTVYAMKKGREM